MHVRFRVNVGSRDAEQHGLDYRLCGQGMTCNVPEKAGQWLVSKGIAHEVPAEIRAVPSTPEITSRAPVARAAETESTTDTKQSRRSAKQSTNSQKDE